ncbi:MAG: hypothetical protein H7238_16285 [Polaromonas sp.]|nr:hypothetical protein [Polaromonas sp.]
MTTALIPNLQVASRARMTGMRLAVALIALCLHAGSALAADPLTSADRLRQFMAQVQPQPSASQAGGQAVREAAALSPARLQERAELLKTGETALARLDVNAALDAFERATLILHAADTEIALVRSYMQGGDYRRALAFGAHTAGAHLDVIGGSTLYAWLLHVGGQPAIAQRLLTASESRMPGNPVVAAVQQQLRSGKPIATGPLLMPPTRLAPYGDTKGLPDTAQVVGTALLLQSGAGALLPLSLLPRSGKLWLRNGLGQLVKAKLDKRLTDVKVALVRLDGPLPTPDDVLVAPGDAFPGSAGFAVEYVSTPDAAPAWPVLRTGFLGGGVGDSGERLLGIDMPAGPRGGPVFDGAGRLIGLALQGPAGAAATGDDRLVPVAQLRKALRGGLAGEQLTAQDAPGLSGSRPRGLVDKIYENSLKSSLQIITAP